MSKHRRQTAGGQGNHRPEAGQPPVSGSGFPPVAGDRPEPAASSSPLRVLICGESLGIGGAERVTVEMANGFAAQPDRYRVELLLRFTSGGLYTADLAAGVQVTVQPRELSSRPPEALHAWFDEFLAGRLPDAVIFNNCRLPGGPHRFTTWKPRLVAHLVHGCSRFSLELLPRPLPEGEVVLTISDEARAGIVAERADLPRERIFVLSNMVDTERFRPARPGEVPVELPWPAARPVFGYCGRFSGEKSLVVLLDCFRRVREQLPDARLLLVGGVDPEVEVHRRFWESHVRTIEQAARQMGLADAVHITGAVRDPERWYRAMDVLCLTSQFEGLPLVALEALASGVPVIAPAVGGLPKLLTDSGGGVAVAKARADLDEQERRGYAREMIRLAMTPARERCGVAGRVHMEREYAISVYRRRLLNWFTARMGQPCLTT